MMRPHRARSAGRSLSPSSSPHCPSALVPSATSPAPASFVHPRRRRLAAPSSSLLHRSQSFTSPLLYPALPSTPFKHPLGSLDATNHLDTLTHLPLLPSFSPSQLSCDHPIPLTLHHLPDIAHRSRAPYGPPTHTQGRCPEDLERNVARPDLRELQTQDPKVWKTLPAGNRLQGNKRGRERVVKTLRLLLPSNNRVVSYLNIRPSPLSPHHHFAMSHSHDDSSSSMDMGSTSTDTGTTSDSMSMMMMKAYLHFTPGDTLIFDTLTPTSAGAVFGACLVLFVIAVGERALLAASRGWAQGRAARSQRLLRAYEFSGDAKDGTAPATPAPAPRRTPFILTHELSRGFLAGAQMTLHYLLMLVVMTFNAAFIISVLLGVFVGEVAFGRLYR